ncbi:hypothetical protein UUR10_0419 [Ureaplasma urealyticum serovar 10 str. ATCC 33699]|uniref:DUF1410 domain-containing protein n=2 Tax=Ureaplasma urealyticum TaxID=2130 RepID=A0AAX1QY12_UREUR|nr:hypothetical protein [Ureaplasma urealyticum]ACI59828.1 hypothetical protein UUR10_0419 [Ureaplasma urealyticum serovar 10 str. ATCC 33699]RCJ01037.1 hypothetical protein DSQ42_02065 [Ureaplasma urealyticum]
MNYQTEKVEFENTPTPTPKPTPTPTPKEDKAVVSSVELVDKDTATKKAKIKLTFSKALVVANETTPSLKLTLTKKGAQETKEVELVLSEDKLSVTTKDLVEFATDTYNVSKLMINDTEANVDAIKSSDLKVAEEAPKEDKAVVSSVELVDKDTATKKAKIKLTFSKALVVANETTPSLKLTLTKKGAQETKEVELVLSEDKLSVTTKDLVEFATDTYNVSKLMINDTEANVDAIKSSDLKVAEEAPKEDKAVVSSVELVDKDTATKKAKIKLTFSKALVVANETTPSLKLTLTKKGAQETKEVELVLSEDKLSVTTKDLVEFATDTYNVSKLMINDTEANVDAIKSSDLKVAEEAPKEDKAVVSSVELVDKDTATKKAKIKLTFSKALVVANETTPSLKLTLTKKGAQETKEVELVLSEDKLSVTTKDLVEFATDTYNVSKLMINDTEANVDAIKSSDLKVA